MIPPGPGPVPGRPWPGCCCSGPPGCAGPARETPRWASPWPRTGRSWHSARRNRRIASGLSRTLRGRTGRRRAPRCRLGAEHAHHREGPADLDAPHAADQAAVPVHAQRREEAQVADLPVGLDQRVGEPALAVPGLALPHDHLEVLVIPGLVVPAPQDGAELPGHVRGLRRDDRPPREPAPLESGAGPVRRRPPEQHQAAQVVADDLLPGRPHQRGDPAGHLGGGLFRPPGHPGCPPADRDRVEDPENGAQHGQPWPSQQQPGAPPQALPRTRQRTPSPLRCHGAGHSTSEGAARAAIHGDP